MRRWAAVAAAGLAAAGFATAAYVVVPEKLNPSTPASAASYLERLELCVSTRSAYVTRVMTVPESLCFAGALAEAAAAGKLPEIEPALHALSQVSPVLCHTPAHFAGAAVFEDPERWPELIDKVDSNACSSGLLHGALERIAVLDWSLPEWAPLVGWCTNAPGHEFEPECAHAIGHAAWDTYRDRVTAGKVCSSFPKPMWQAFCAEGVVMQEFRPPGRPAEVIALDRSVDVTWVCEHLPSMPAPDANAARFGCLEGVGFLVFREFEDALGPDAAIESFDVVLDELYASVAACQQFGIEANACLMRFFFMMGFAAHSKLEPDVLCPRAPEFADLCFSQMREAALVIESAGEFLGTWRYPEPS